MSPDRKKSSVTRITLNLVAASLLSGCIIAGVHALTAPKIEENRKMMSEEAMRRLVPSATDFVLDSSGNRFEATSAQGLQGYIVPAEGRGYGGTIKMTAAVSPDGKLIGFEILSANETPGLGDRAGESSFRDQFKGRSKGQFEVTKTGEKGKIDAISGATITSKAVAGALDRALTALDSSLQAQGKSEPAPLSGTSSQSIGGAK